MSDPGTGTFPPPPAPVLPYGDPHLGQDASACPAGNTDMQDCAGDGNGAAASSHAVVSQCSADTVGAGVDTNVQPAADGVDDGPGQASAAAADSDHALNCLPVIEPKEEYGVELGQLLQQDSMVHAQQTNCEPEPQPGAGAAGIVPMDETLHQAAAEQPQLEPSAAADAAADLQAQALAAAAAEAEARAAAATEAAEQVVAAVKAEADARAAAQALRRGGADTQAACDAQADVEDMQTDADTDTDADAEADRGVDADAGVFAQAEANAEAHAGPGANAEVTAEAEANAAAADADAAAAEAEEAEAEEAEAAATLAAVSGGTEMGVDCDVDMDGSQVPVDNGHGFPALSHRKRARKTKPPSSDETSPAASSPPPSPPRAKRPTLSGKSPAGTATAAPCTTDAAMQLRTLPRPDGGSPPPPAPASTAATPRTLKASNPGPGGEKMVLVGPDGRPAKRGPGRPRKILPPGYQLVAASLLGPNGYVKGRGGQPANHGDTAPEPADLGPTAAVAAAPVASAEGHAGAPPGAGGDPQSTTAPDGAELSAMALNVRRQSSRCSTVTGTNERPGGAPSETHAAEPDATAADPAADPAGAGPVEPSPAALADAQPVAQEPSAATLGAHAPSGSAHATRTSPPSSTMGSPWRSPLVVAAPPTAAAVAAAAAPGPLPPGLAERMVLLDDSGNPVKRPRGRPRKQLPPGHQLVPISALPPATLVALAALDAQSPHSRSQAQLQQGINAAGQGTAQTSAPAAGQQGAGAHPPSQRQGRSPVQRRSQARNAPGAAAAAPAAAAAEGLARSGPVPGRPQGHAAAAAAATAAERSRPAAPSLGPAGTNLRLVRPHDLGLQCGLTAAEGQEGAANHDAVERAAGRVPDRGPGRASECQQRHGDAQQAASLDCIQQLRVHDRLPDRAMDAEHDARIGLARLSNGSFERRLHTGYEQQQQGAHGGQERVAAAGERTLERDGRARGGNPSPVVIIQRGPPPGADRAPVLVVPRAPQRGSERVVVVGPSLEDGHQGERGSGRATTGRGGGGGHATVVLAPHAGAERMPVVVLERSREGREADLTDCWGARDTVPTGRGPPPATAPAPRRGGAEHAAAPVVLPPHRSSDRAPVVVVGRSPEAQRHLEEGGEGRMQPAMERAAAAAPGGRERVLLAVGGHHPRHASLEGERAHEHKRVLPMERAVHAAAPHGHDRVVVVEPAPQQQQQEQQQRGAVAAEGRERMAVLLVDGPPVQQRGRERTSVLEHMQQLQLQRQLRQGLEQGAQQGRAHDTPPVQRPQSPPQRHGNTHERPSPPQQQQNRRGDERMHQHLDQHRTLQGAERAVAAAAQRAPQQELRGHKRLLVVDQVHEQPLEQQHRQERALEHHLAARDPRAYDRQQEREQPLEQQHRHARALDPRGLKRPLEQRTQDARDHEHHLEPRNHGRSLEQRDRGRPLEHEHVGHDRYEGDGGEAFHGRDRPLEQRRGRDQLLEARGRERALQQSNHEPALERHRAYARGHDVGQERAAGAAALAQPLAPAALTLGPAARMMARLAPGAAPGQAAAAAAAPAAAAVWVPAAAGAYTPVHNQQAQAQVLAAARQWPGATVVPAAHAHVPLPAAPTLHLAPVRRAAPSQQQQPEGPSPNQAMTLDLSRPPPRSMQHLRRPPPGATMIPQYDGGCDTDEDDDGSEGEEEEDEREAQRAWRWAGARASGGSARRAARRAAAPEPGALPPAVALLFEGMPGLARANAGREARSASSGGGGSAAGAASAGAGPATASGGTGRMSAPPPKGMLKQLTGGHKAAPGGRLAADVARAAGHAAEQGYANGHIDPLEANGGGSCSPGRRKRSAAQQQQPLAGAADAKRRRGESGALEAPAGAGTAAANGVTGSHGRAAAMTCSRAGRHAHAGGQQTGPAGARPRRQQVLPARFAGCALPASAASQPAGKAQPQQLPATAAVLVPALASTSPASLGKRPACPGAGRTSTKEAAQASQQQAGGSGSQAAHRTVEKAANGGSPGRSERTGRAQGRSRAKGVAKHAVGVGECNGHGPSGEAPGMSPTHRPVRQRALPARFNDAAVQLNAVLPAAAAAVAAAAAAVRAPQRTQASPGANAPQDTAVARASGDAAAARKAGSGAGAGTGDVAKRRAAKQVASRAHSRARGSAAAATAGAATAGAAASPAPAAADAKRRSRSGARRKGSDGSSARHGAPGTTAAPAGTVAAPRQHQRKAALSMPAAAGPAAAAASPRPKSRSGSRKRARSPTPPPASRSRPQPQPTRARPTRATTPSRSALASPPTSTRGAAARPASVTRSAAASAGALPRSTRSQQRRLRDRPALRAPTLYSPPAFKPRGGGGRSPKPKPKAAAAAAASGPAAHGASVVYYREMLRRTKRYVQAIKQEEHALAAYEAEGWRGASTKKVQLTADMQRSRAALERCKVAVRACLAACDAPPGLTPISADLFDEGGALQEDHIFCGVCGSYTMTEDNDMVLCDGVCNCAFHERCITPHLDAKQLPKDEGWLCPACDCKADILQVLEDEFGLSHELSDPWDTILPPDGEEAPAPHSPRPGHGHGHGHGHGAGGGRAGGHQQGTRRSGRRASGGGDAPSSPVRSSTRRQASAAAGGRASRGSGGAGGSNAQGRVSSGGGSQLAPGSRSGSGGRQRPQRRARTAAAAANGLSGPQRRHHHHQGWLAQDLPSESEEDDEDFEGEAEASAEHSGSDEDAESMGGSDDGEGGEGEEVVEQLDRRARRKQVDYVALSRQLFGSAAAAAESEEEEDEDFKLRARKPRGSRPPRKGV